MRALFISLLAALLTSLLPLASLSARGADGSPLWADIRDVIQYVPKAVPDATLIQAAMSVDARFLVGGARFAYGLHLEYAPTQMASGNSSYRAVALMTAAGRGLFYRKFAIEIGGSPRRIQALAVAKDLELSRMHFTISTGLIDRMVVVEDSTDDVMMVFPLAVGGIDENAMGAGNRILTPQFHGAYIDRSTVVASMTDPSYYRGRPLMRITNRNGLLTGIAFHITILSDQDWRTRGPNYLPRGFESHGCMRMRERDLLEFFTVVISSSDQRIPVNVDYFVWNRDAQGLRDQRLGQVAEIHPYPFADSSYTAVSYFPDRNPHYALDSEGLVVMADKSGLPDLGHLSDFSADDATDLSAFRGLEAGMNHYRDSGY